MLVTVTAVNEDTKDNFKSVMIPAAQLDGVITSLPITTTVFSLNALVMYTNKYQNNPSKPYSKPWKTTSDCNIDSRYLKERRKYVIVIIFAVAAILTPPDPITQIGLGIPLLILYELSILSVKLIEKKKDNA